MQNNIMHVIVYFYIIIYHNTFDGNNALNFFVSLTEYKISNNFVIFIIPHLYKYTSRKKSYPHALMIDWLKKVSKEFFPTFQLRSLRWIKKLISIEDI